MERLARASIVVLLLAAVAVPPVRGNVGDVAPRAEPDGLVRVSDLVLALRMVRGDDEPSADELLRLDVSAGMVDPSLVNPPSFTARGDGTLGLADVAVLHDAVLSRIRLLDAPGLTLRDGLRVALVGEVYANRLVLASPSLAAPAFSLGASVENAVVDPVTGDLTFEPAPAQVGDVAMQLRAEQDGAIFGAVAVLEVVAPVSLAAGQVGAAGGSVEVVNPASPLDGVRVDVPPGALDADTAITIATAEPDAGTVLLPTVVVSAASSGVPFDISLHPSADVIAAAGGAENIAWEMLVLPVADCDGGAGVTEMHSAWAAWVRLLTHWEGGAVFASSVTGCGGPAFLRLVAISAPPPACPVANEGERVQLDVRHCPVPGAFTLEQARAAFEDAVLRCESLGYVLPAQVRVVIDDLPNGREAGLDPMTDGVVHVDRHLSPALLRTVASHETMHLAQLPFLPVGCPARLDASRVSAFLLEGSAAWLEQVVLDGAGDPDPAAFHLSRKYGYPARRSLDSLGPEAWLFFNWLETSKGIAPLDVLEHADPAALALPGGALQAVDAALRDAGGGSFEEGLAEFMHQVNVERSPQHVLGIDELGWPEPRREVLGTDDTEEAPANLCEALLPHASGITWIVEFPATLPADAAAMLRVQAQGATRAELWSLDTNERVREVPIGESVSLGTHRGAFALHVLNPELVEEAGGPSVADLSAWVASSVPWWTDSDGDGWLDDTEAEAGSDALDATSTPARVVIGLPAARAFLPSVGDPNDVVVNVVIGNPPARAFLPWVGDPADVSIPVVVGMPPARAFLPWVGDPADVSIPVVVGTPPARAFLPWVGDPADVNIPVVVGSPPARAFLPSVGDPADVNIPVVVGTPPAKVTLP